MESREIKLAHLYDSVKNYDWKIATDRENLYYLCYIQTSVVLTDLQILTWAKLDGTIAGDQLGGIRQSLAVPNHLKDRC